MANSIAIANVEIQLADGLQSSIPPVLFRTVPPIQMPSNTQVAYNGYTYLTPPNSETILLAGTHFGGRLGSPFVYLRNAGQRGIISASIEFAVASSGTSVMNLLPGGVFLFANSFPFAPLTVGGVTTLSITPFDTNPIIAEWLYAI